MIWFLKVLLLLLLFVEHLKITKLEIVNMAKLHASKLFLVSSIVGQTVC